MLLIVCRRIVGVEAKSHVWMCANALQETSMSCGINVVGHRRNWPNMLGCIAHTRAMSAVARAIRLSLLLRNLPRLLASALESCWISIDTIKAHKPCNPLQGNNRISAMPSPSIATGRVAQIAPPRRPQANADSPLHAESLASLLDGLHQRADWVRR